jgi:hypothetical protein
VTVFKPILREAWIVAADLGERMVFLRKGYRGDLTGTSRVEWAQQFASPDSADIARRRYVERHRASAEPLTRWQVVLATMQTTFHMEP